MASHVTKGVIERQRTEHSAWYPSALKTPAGSMAVTIILLGKSSLPAIRLKPIEGQSHAFEDLADAQGYTPSLNISTEDWPGTGLAQALETHCSLWLTDA